MENIEESLPDTDQALKPLDGSLIRLFIDNQAVFKGFLRRHLPSDKIAEDLLQQGLLKAVKGEGSLLEKDNAVAWFYRILRNSLIDFIAPEARKSGSSMRFSKTFSTPGKAAMRRPMKI